MKQIKINIELLKEKLKAARKKKRRKKLVAPQPRYDEVYASGVEWLDALAAEPMLISDFKCTACNEVFEDIYFIPETVMTCPFCDSSMEQYGTEHKS